VTSQLQDIFSRSYTPSAALHSPTEDNRYNDYIIFEDREDAARRLAVRLKPLLYQIQKREDIKSIDRSNTCILGIPRGGVGTGDVLASILGLNLDISFKKDWCS
jgi:hypothetical protein